MIFFSIDSGGENLPKTPSSTTLMPLIELFANWVSDSITSGSEAPRRHPQRKELREQKFIQGDSDQPDMNWASARATAQRHVKIKFSLRHATVLMLSRPRKEISLRSSDRYLWWSILVESGAPCHDMSDEWCQRNIIGVIVEMLWNVVACSAAQSSAQSASRTPTFLACLPATFDRNWIESTLSHSLSDPRIKDHEELPECLSLTSSNWKKSGK